jgi:hypothetical protein
MSCQTFTVSPTLLAVKCHENYGDRSRPEGVLGGLRRQVDGDAFDSWNLAGLPFRPYCEVAIH